MSSFKTIRKMDIDPVWLLRIFTVIPAALIVLAGAGALWMYFFVMSLLPDSQSRIDLPGLMSEVRVVRDRRGVPGILGENEHDAAMVLGYVMAQDRLWQMDFLRRASQGRLAEILGWDYLELDHLMRTVTAGRSGAAIESELSEPQLKWVESFVKGINLYIARHSGKLPVEFSLLEYRPEPFSVKDVLGICLALAKETSPALRVDPVLVRILGKLGPRRGLELFPGDPAAGKRLVVSDLLGWEPDGLLFRFSPKALRLTGVPGFRGGCVWALGREKTRSSNAMAGCMVYQSLTAPGFWYRARIVAGDFHLSGVFVPGVPVALAGSNGDLAWGSIAAPADDADLFVERLDGDDPKNYWRVDRWRPIRRISETYRIKGGGSEDRTIMLTQTGPIVSNVWKGRALSLRWTGREGVGLLSAFYSLNRTARGDEIPRAVRSLVCPVMYIVWAGSEGGRGIRMAGRVPVRSPRSDGIVPLPAWTAVHDWRGYIPPEELPAARTWDMGPLVAADGRPGGPDYPYLVSCYWNDEWREGRIRKLLTETPEHSRKSFQRIVEDTKSPLAQDLVPLLVNAARQSPSLGPRGTEAVGLLRSWNFEMAGDSPAAALFALTYQELVRELLMKNLGEDCYLGFSRRNQLVARAIRKIFVQGQAAWLGKTQPQELLLACLRRAVKEGRATMGDDLSKWRWDEIHRAVFQHPLTARSRFLELLYHVGPLPMPGAGDTIDLAAWSPAHPFLVREGVSLRQISDMTHPPELAGITPLGISAHFFSPHYKDQIAAWRRGGYFRDPIMKADITQSGLSTVRFIPEAGRKLSLR